MTARRIKPQRTKTCPGCLIGFISRHSECAACRNPKSGSLHRDWTIASYRLLPLPAPTWGQVFRGEIKDHVADLFGSVRDFLGDITQPRTAAAVAFFVGMLVVLCAAIVGVAVFFALVLP